MAKRKQKPPYLLARFGGKGDALFLTAVAHQLTARFDVHVAVNATCAALLENNPDIKRIFPVERFGPPPMQRNRINGHPVDMVQVDDAWITVEALSERYPGTGLRRLNFTNYRFVIESNGMHPDLWATQNSDYVNTYNQHLGWAGLDPHTIDPHEKRPYYWTTAKERKWAKSVLDSLPRPIVMVQTFASSPARTYYRLSALVEWLTANVGTLLVWYGQGWRIGRSMLPAPQGIDSMRATAALIEQADLLISADTCVSHLAEAVQTQSLVYYSTVPAWTRSQYYEYSTYIDCEVTYDGQPCKCCVIARDCPRRQAESMNAMTDRERALLKWLNPEHKQQLGLQDVGDPEPGAPPHERFGTSPQGFEAAAQAAATKYDSLRQREAFCIESLDLLSHAKEAVANLKGGE